MQHEVLSSDVTSSKTSCDNHDNLPNVIMGGKPGALPNSQFLKIEDPVRRKVQTASVIGKNNTRGFELSPPEVDMWVLKEGHTYVHSVILRNIGIDSCRFKVRQPSPSTGIKVLFNHGPDFETDSVFSQTVMLSPNVPRKHIDGLQRFVGWSEDNRGVDFYVLQDKQGSRPIVDNMRMFIVVKSLITCPKVLVFDHVV
ncbi:uncharacterized protein LOC124441020 [Xenia sp. Carnegie-2017]|uniref:uncharacterized protein LOC124441020 n=1 Tax=Xenia sp. Carnegie-2017 TaxID=2897299 RepID=UPI001F04CB30|nr:uncharacterized protein LOC124441020 [Xenia sp. Carnegie-2017]